MNIKTLENRIVKLNEKRKDTNIYIVDHLPNGKIMLHAHGNEPEREITPEQVEELGKTNQIIKIIDAV